MIPSTRTFRRRSQSTHERPHVAAITRRRRRRRLTGQPQYPMGNGRQPPSRTALNAINRSHTHTLLPISCHLYYESAVKPSIAQCHPSSFFDTRRRYLYGRRAAPAGMARGLHYKSAQLLCVQNASRFVRYTPRASVCVKATRAIHSHTQV